jgi:hypothetical protein
MQLTTRIITNLRPLRPPNRSTCLSSRHFTTLPSLLRFNHLRARPQVPYLSPSPQWASSRRWQIFRPITTEKARLLKKTGWDVAMAFALVAAIVPSTLGFMWWISHEMMERDYPTPPQWSFRTRCYWHTAKGLEDRSVTHGRIPDWSVISFAIQALLNRLEDTTSDGEGITLVEKLDTSHLPPAHVTFDLSSVYDVSAMPEPWRRGYYQALLQAAKTAEASEKLVHDTTTQGLHMLEFVVGPSNPDPTPLPPQARIAPPLEDDCIRYFPSADPFYRKLLATRGLSDRQRIQSLISFSEWLDTQGQSAEAERHLRIALEVAANALPRPAAVVDIKTGVLKNTAPYVTRNVMDTTTALAVHLAQHSKAYAALPIFLSTLQAYRSCTVESSSGSPQGKRYDGAIPTDVLMAGIRSRVSEMFKTVDYPPPPASGNEPLSRSGDEQCKAAAAMVYASEILFSSSESQRETALSWTKEVLRKASERVSDTSVPMDDREQCNQCISVALDTWWSMAQQLKAEDEASGISTALPVHKSSDIRQIPRWRREEMEHWNQVKQVDRSNWEEKMMYEQMKVWSWMPESTLRRIL